MILGGFVPGASQGVVPLAHRSGIDRVTGEKLWEYRCRARIDSSAVVCAGKAAIFGSDDGYVYALDLKEGKELWQYEIGSSVKTSPAVAGDYVLFGADDGVLYCFKNAAAATPEATGKNQ